MSFREAVAVWAQVGLNSFGGPAGQIAVMHRFLVEQRRWISERRFLHALNYCMLLPGPEAQQLAVYVGWLLHGLRGGLVAGTLFVLPGFVTILALSVVYAGFGDVAPVAAVFYGIKPAVLAVVAAAVVRIGRRSLHSTAMFATAVAAFVAIFFFDVPFPIVIVAAGAVGLAGGRLRPHSFVAPMEPDPDGSEDTGAAVAISDHADVGLRPSVARSLATLAVGLSLWLVPVGLLVAARGAGDVYTKQGVFFSTSAVVTFGGAYSVLSYVAQQAVQVHGWLEPGEMLDGLGMAETTPGPLIQVVQFVGFLGAYRLVDGLHPMLAGALAAVLVTWVTFVPCFLWIFLGAPYIESLRGNKALTSALSGVTAAVVGAVLNLALWFALHAIFADVSERRMGGLRLLIPQPATIDPAALLIAVLAFVALFRWKWPVLRTLLASAAMGGTYHLLTAAV